jgi:CSLREA domain-containing protein
MAWQFSKILLLRALMSANGFPGSARRFFLLRYVSTQLIGCFCVASLFLASAMAAMASTYTVTNLNDSGSGSLRAAITSANSDPAGNIVFASGVVGTITLQSSLPTVTLASGSMTITGPGATKLTISGQNKYQVMAIATGTVTVAGLTITNGSVASGTGYTKDPGWGGAFYVAASATLNLQNDVLTNNTTTGGGGGAILTEGNLNVSGTTFSGNTVPTGDGGAAIFNIGVLKVTGSTFSYNTAVNEGSVILNYGYGPIGTATISDSTFVNNTVPPGGGGGAIYNEPGATLTVRDSTFAGNTPNVGGSIANGGSMTLSNDIFAEPTSTSFQCTASAPPASQCPANPSSPDANGNFDEIVSNLNLLPLGYYGGITQTMLPQAGSALICGGTSVGAKSVSGTALTVDQRGFGIDASCATGEVDAGAVQTSRLTVTTTGDAGNGSCGATCTLRDAVTAANAAGHGDIGFANGLTGTIALSSELPVISGTVDIVGPGANLLTVSGNSANMIFGVTSGTLDLSWLTIANGKSASNGGAISNASGLVTLNNVVLSGNSATSDGGAIFNGGTVLASDSTFWGNRAALGSAIYNTGAVGLEYSTVAGNTASSGGGVYNNSGAVLRLANTTFAANTGTGAGIDNLGSLSVANSILDASAACAGSGCPTSVNGNVVGATHLAPLGYYGGLTPTVLPQPGSSAICAGSDPLIPADAISDQRGFANENITYAGYSATVPCADAGAVQTNYTAVQFAATGPYSATANTPGTTPMLIASVTENGQNIGGVLVTLTFSGTGSATGLTATTVAGTGATFSSLVVTQPSASGDTLSITLPVVGAAKLTAAPVNLTVGPGSQVSQTITFTGLPATATYGAAGPYTLNAKASSGLPVSYSVTGPGSISGSTLTITGTGTVVVTASQAGNAGYLAAPSVAQTINVVAPFTIAVNPPNEVLFGGDIAIFLLQLQASNGFNGKVSLSCAGGPAGIECINFPMTVTFFNGQALAISGAFFPANTQPGTYTLTFTGTSGAASSSATATFTVQSAPQGWFW